jgi:hypothetical protein
LFFFTNINASNPRHMKANGREPGPVRGNQKKNTLLTRDSLGKAGPIRENQGQLGPIETNRGQLQYRANMDQLGSIRTNWG